MYDRNSQQKELSFYDLQLEIVNAPFSRMLNEVRLAGGCQTTVPHSTIRIHTPWRCYDFWNWKVDVVSVAYANSDATETRKGTMDL